MRIGPVSTLCLKFAVKEPVWFNKEASPPVLESILLMSPIAEGSVGTPVSGGNL